MSSELKVKMIVIRIRITNILTKLRLISSITYVK